MQTICRGTLPVMDELTPCIFYFFFSKKKEFSLTANRDTRCHIEIQLMKMDYVNLEHVP